jgi:hypothetical protein
MRELQNYNIKYQPGPSTHIDQLENISRASNTTANRQEQVLSPGRISSISSPTVIPLQKSQSKNSSQHQTSHDTPIQLKSEDIN